MNRNELSILPSGDDVFKSSSRELQCMINLEYNERIMSSLTAYKRKVNQELNNGKNEKVSSSNYNLDCICNGGFIVHVHFAA